VAASLQKPVASQDDPGFWSLHLINEYVTGPANKDLGNLECDVGFALLYAFGTGEPDNSEEKVHNTVLENVYTEVYQWGTGDDQYMSCCPPGSVTNPDDYYRCNTWTTDAADNCHTTGLPFNNGQITAPGGKRGVKVSDGNWQWMYSFPAAGEGTTWRQGIARRVLMEDLAWAWIDEAGGCNSCVDQGKDVEDPCFGECLQHYDYTALIHVTQDVLADQQNYPNYGIPGTEGILFAGDTSKCIELSSGDSSSGTAIDLWDCNGLVNQAWYWASDSNKIMLGGHEEAGMCIDLPNGEASNGNALQLWACNDGDSQNWSWDNGQIRYKADPNFCIDLPGAITDNGNQLWLWECNGGDSQQWSIYAGLSGAGPLAQRRDKQRVNNTRKKPKVHRPWMHDIQKILQTVEKNWTRPADFVPWYERKGFRDWHAAQMPGPGLPRPLVPHGWKGYNNTSVYV